VEESGVTRTEADLPVPHARRVAPCGLRLSRQTGLCFFAAILFLAVLQADLGLGVWCLYYVARSG
jgi:hypothetical protein